MAHTYSGKKGTLYRYYVCDTKQKQGRGACDAPSLAAQDIERFVVQQIRQIGSDPQLVQEVYEEAIRQQQGSIPQLKAEYGQLLVQRQQKGEELKRLLHILATTDEPQPSVTEHLRETEELTASLDQRLTEIKTAIDHAESQTIDAEHLQETLKQFDPIWDVLQSPERVELVQQLVDVVYYNADDDTVSVTFHHTAPEQPRHLRTRRRHQFQDNSRAKTPIPAAVR